MTRDDLDRPKRRAVIPFVVVAFVVFFTVFISARHAATIGALITAAPFAAVGLLAAAIRNPSRSEVISLWILLLVIIVAAISFVWRLGSHIPPSGF
jgi:hypothetical protein